MESDIIIDSRKEFAHQVPNGKLTCYHDLLRAFRRVPDGKVTCELI